MKKQDAYRPVFEQDSQFTEDSDNRTDLPTDYRTPEKAVLRSFFRIPLTAVRKFVIIQNSPANAWSVCRYKGINASPRSSTGILLPEGQYQPAARISAEPYIVCFLLNTTCDKKP